MSYGNIYCPLECECGLSGCVGGREFECEYFQENAYGRLFYLDLNNLHGHPDNPRKDLGDLTELAESIKTTGILQNLTVVPCIKTNSFGKDWMAGYRVIIGHRRMAAAKRAGLEKVPCVIAKMDEREQLGTMLLENMQRSDLTTYEKAEGFQLMLDMGETVATIAEKTGLSETTIRRHAKLTKLDKAKFKAAESRGGTMQDYEKLAKIEDPEVRNEVLEKVGTNNFEYELKRALSDQKDKAYLEKITAQLRESDWCQELTEPEKAGLLTKKEICYFGNYGTWNQRELTKPVDAEKRRYYFYVGKHQVDVYRDAPKESEETAAQRRKRELKEQLDAISEELEFQNQEFRDLREEFIENFSAFHTYDDDIRAFGVKALLHGRGLDKESLAEWLNIAYDDEKRRIDEKELDAALSRRSDEVLLYTAYLFMEDACCGWNTRCWDDDIGCFKPVAREDENLDRLYSCLRSLGYQWSTAEQRASVGDSDQLREAQRLIDAYKAEEAGEQA